MEDMFIQIVTSLGFPAAAFYLMYKFCTESIKENTKAINKLAVIIAKIEGRIATEEREEEQ